METLTVRQFKARFSEIIEKVKAGESVAVTYGKRKEIVGVFQPGPVKQPKRQIGILKGKMTHKFHQDFKFDSDDLFLES